PERPDQRPAPGFQPIFRLGLLLRELRELRLERGRLGFAPLDAAGGFHRLSAQCFDLCCERARFLSQLLLPLTIALQGALDRPEPPLGSSPVRGLRGGGPDGSVECQDPGEGTGEGAAFHAADYTRSRTPLHGGNRLRRRCSFATAGTPVSLVRSIAIPCE